MQAKPGAAAPQARIKAAAAATTTRKMHVQAVKIYSCIFALFTMSMLVVVLVRIVETRSFAYLYYLNNVAKPFIYYVLIDSFRAKVNVYCRKLKCC